MLLFVISLTGHTLHRMGMHWVNWEWLAIHKPHTKLTHRNCNCWLGSATLKHVLNTVTCMVLCPFCYFFFFFEYLLLQRNISWWALLPTVNGANPNPDLQIQYSIQIFVKLYLDLDFICGLYMYLDLDLLVVDLCPSLAPHGPPIYPL